MLWIPGPMLQLQATQNHVPLQRYFPGVFSQYVPSLHKEESSRHSFLSEDKHDIHMMSLALFPRPRPHGRKGSTFSPPTWPGKANEVTWYPYPCPCNLTWQLHDLHNITHTHLYKCLHHPFRIRYHTQRTLQGLVQCKLSYRTHHRLRCVWYGNVGRCVSNAH